MTTEETLPTCARHPDRETRLSCRRCGRPVCDVCLAAADGGSVCPVCRDELAGAAPTTTAPTAPVRARGRRGAPLTFGLLGVLTLISFAVFGLGYGGLFEAGAQINPLVEAGQWWRVPTATLLHAGLMHLLFNGYALYLLGAQLERGVGSAAFAALYVASALAGGIAFLLTVPGGVAVGASGAIFGLFGAWFAAAWVNRDTPQGRAGLSQFGILLAINMALPLFIPNIAWQAHVGGLLAGVAVGLAWARQGRAAPHRRSTSLVTMPAVLSGVLLAVLFWYTMSF